MSDQNKSFQRKDPKKRVLRRGDLREVAMGKDKKKKGKGKEKTAEKTEKKLKSKVLKKTGEVTKHKVVMSDSN